MRIRPTSTKAAPRRGVVLLAVLVVVVIMALIAYNYSDRMVMEYQGATNTHRAAQLKCFADSGIAYMAAMVASPDNINNYLSGNPYDNPAQLNGVPVADPDGLGQGGTFSFIAPVDADLSANGSGGVRYGATDESGKININSLMALDPTGAKLQAMLLKLPNMPSDLAACIVDYVDADTVPLESGAEDEYYGSLTPPSRAKNGPLDSLEELLFVKGMTRDLLYGADLNRNGIADADETPFSSNADRGFAAFLTVWSREANRDSTGQAYINVNGDDLSVIANRLGPLVPIEVLNFIILYRQNGPAAATTNNSTNNANKTAVGNLSNYTPDLTKTGSTKLTSFLDLIGAQVSVSGSMGGAATVYASPFADANTAADAFAALYQVGSMNDNAETPARINVNTAPREVLMCIDGLLETDVETIIATRPKWGATDSTGTNFQSLIWLASQAQITLQTLKSLESTITTRSQVFHMQVIGQFDSGTGTGASMGTGTGPTARVEAIVDANYGQPRIVFYRDWSEMGRTKLPQ